MSEIWLLRSNGLIHRMQEGEKLPFDKRFLDYARDFPTPLFSSQGKYIGDVIEVSAEGTASVICVGLGGYGADEQYPLGYVEKTFSVEGPFDPSTWRFSTMETHVHCHNCGLPMSPDALSCDNCNATARPPAVKFPPLRKPSDDADPRVTAPTPRHEITDPRRTHGG